MSRKLTVVLLAMLILVGAMSLKTVVTAQDNGAVIMANGGAPVPPTPWKNGGAPVSPDTVEEWRSTRTTDALEVARPLK